MKQSQAYSPLDTADFHSDEEDAPKKEEFLGVRKGTLPGFYQWSGTKPIGIQYERAGDRILIQQIHPGGSIAKWNFSHPESKVSVGDEIIALYEGNERVDLRLFEEEREENPEEKLGATKEEVPEEDIPIELRSSSYKPPPSTPPQKKTRISYLTEYLFSLKTDMVVLELLKSERSEKSTPSASLQDTASTTSDDFERSVAQLSTDLDATIALTEKTFENTEEGDELVVYPAREKRPNLIPHGHREVGEKLIFTVTLTRPLGIRIDSKRTPRGTRVIVSKVDPRGAAARWNRTTPVHCERVRVYDRLLAFYESDGTRVDVSEWSGKQISEKIQSLGDTVTIELERVEGENCCCVIS